MPALRKACGLILLLIVLLKLFSFGSSVPVEKRSVCRCALSCDGAEPELNSWKSVHVRVEHHSDDVHDEIYNVSSLLKEDGRCAVVVQKCLQQGTQYTLRIYADEDKPVPEKLYEATALKPECYTEEPEERILGGADRNSPNTLLILMICCLLLVFFKIRCTHTDLRPAQD